MFEAVFPQPMKSLLLISRLTLLIATVTVIASAQFTFTTFDVPGAVGTFPFAINNNGDIAGLYTTSAGNTGFIRKADGTFTSFDLSSVNGSVFKVEGLNDSRGDVGSV